jgi:hypothetical protein
VQDDDAAHRRRWAAWLYWGNLIQFLDAAGGDGAQLARTTLDAFQPAELAVSEGTGLVTARRALALDDETATWLGRSPAAPVAGPAAAGGLDEAKTDQHWRDVVALLMPDESGLESLVRALAARGAPPPKQGFELGDAGWQAELAWPERRIAVVLVGDLHDNETADRDKAFAAHGWDARTARQWSVDDLAEKVMQPSGRTGERR